MTEFVLYYNDERLRSAAGRVLDSWTEWSVGRLTRTQLLDQVAQDKARIGRFLPLVASLRLQDRVRSTLDTLTEAYPAQLRGTAHPSLLLLVAATR